jgi:pentose-5-phosphate-3-epimerase/putative flippase GtrA/broad specificity phosphatase PhoE
MILNNKPIKKTFERLASTFKSSQFLKFCFFGGISTIINYLFFFLLYKIGINYLVSSACGYISGVFVGFILNRRFTFKSTSKKYAIEITKYFAVYAVSLVLGLAFLKFQVNLEVPVLLANIFTIALTTLTNFVGSKYLVFEKHTFRTKANFLLYRYKYLIRYVIIGLTSIFIEVLAIELARRLVSFTGLNIHDYAIIISGFLCGVIFAFILNSKINFPVPKNRNLRTFRMFLVISIFAFVLNLLLMKFVFSQFEFFSYNIMRFVTAGIVFIVSYTLHRRFTFVYVKEVGIAAYLNKSEDVAGIKSKIQFFPDFIHIDLVDKTYNPNAEEVDPATGRAIQKAWPFTKKMTHIMSKNTSKWINEVYKFSDYIIFHVETDENIFDLIDLCRKLHRKPGISVLYNTSTDSIIKYLPYVDIVQVLGIPKPGESSQHLDPAAIEKLEILNLLKEKYNFEISFDGGVKLSNIHKINAKYIVSASTVLTAPDPKKALYDLKTSSRYYLAKDHDLKTYIKKSVRNIIENTGFVVSGTLVGSFAKKPGLEGISDVDIIVIIDELTKQKFEMLVQKFRSLEKIIRTDYDYDLIINTTFGPLKFNKEKTVVLHLMIYDVNGHIEHCKKSPFTCLDWQNSESYIKKPMSSVWKVTALQPNQFFSARRSVNDYLKDLNSGAISYREYEFSDNSAKEVKKSKKMTNKDRFEFSYHIMKFCMLNFLKLHNKENKDYGDDLPAEYFRIFPLNAKEHLKIFRKIREMKDNNNYYDWNSSYRQNLSLFLNDFQTQFRNLYEKEATRLVFIRHQKTSMNKPGVFIGQKSNPDIRDVTAEEIDRIHAIIGNCRFAAAYSSPSLRCIRTIDTLKERIGTGQTIIDDLLKEIDYGEIDGKDYQFLKTRYPDIISQWEKGADPRFPGGENIQDVNKRLARFLAKLHHSRGKSFMICTHNVVLRCLIGSQLDILRQKWFKIAPEHLDPIELILTEDGKFFINLRPEQAEQALSEVEMGEN